MMKKTLCSLIASFAFMQVAMAIPSNLGESLIEYNALVSSALITQVIPQAEFIIDIKRVTRDLDADTIIYNITTLIQGKKRDTEKKYRAKLEKTENPLIGPPLITVVSIKPISSHSHRFFIDEYSAE